MAGAVPGAAAVSSGTQFRFTHVGPPDYNNTASLLLLGEDPWVHLEGTDHPLVKATSFAAWQDSPIVPPATTCPGKCLRQSVLDSWCLLGGVVTPAFKAHKNVLLRSVRADKAGDFFAAHTCACRQAGSLDRPHRTYLAERPGFLSTSMPGRCSCEAGG